MFDNGIIKVRCAANIFKVYHRSEERIIEQEQETINHASNANLYMNKTTDIPLRK